MAAIVSSRDIVEFSLKSTFCVYKTVINSQKTCLMFSKLSQEKSHRREVMFALFYSHREEVIIH